jgi:ribosomal protein S18 acetylase RimI-like enzyme
MAPVSDPSVRAVSSESEGEPVVLSRLDQAAFRRRSVELIKVYLTAMNYPADLAGARAALWEEHSRRAGFSCVVATEGDRITGLAYGYHGAPGQWWYAEVRRGISSAADQELADFFELTELHVHPDWQGHGLGEALLRALASDRPERRILLSTPEGENRAWRLYRRLGFTDVLRSYRFTGDPRPFGVLGRDLPLAPPAPPGRAAG